MAGFLGLTLPSSSISLFLLRRARAMALLRNAWRECVVCVFVAVAWFNKVLREVR